MVLRLALFLFICCGAAHAAPPQRGPSYPHMDPNAHAIQEMRGEVDHLRHEVSNHELEIRMYEEKLGSMESIIESLRDQITTTSKSHKDQLKGNTESLEEKLNSLDTTTKGLVADVRQFKTFSTDANNVLGQYKQRITDLEKTVSQQNQNIEHLQAAMKALMEAMGVKQAPQAKAIAEATTAGSDPSAIPTSFYKIQPGDSLEKIAKANKTSVSIIKQLNNLTNDKIIVGKQIKVPEAPQ